MDGCSAGDLEFSEGTCDCLGADRTTGWKRRSRDCVSKLWSCIVRVLCRDRVLAAIQIFL